jgi:hypothetical protein
MRTLVINRLRRLEDRGGGAGSCPACAGKCVTLRGEQAPPRCELCGKELFTIRVVRDVDFYRNRERLREVGAVREGE